jgi:hypothetical protein
MNILRRLIPAVAVLGALTGFSVARNAGPALTKLEGHRSNLEARLVFTDGSTRTVTLEGVGCPVAMCSRVAVNTRAKGTGQIEKIWLDSISSIQDITGGEALFVFKDGTQQRLSVVQVNQVLYAAAGAGKIDLSRIQSLTFVPTR